MAYNSALYIPSQAQITLASILMPCNDGAMKNKLMTFRASDDERDKWAAALERDGRSLSAVCRAALNRLAKRHERKTQEQAE